MAFQIHNSNNEPISLEELDQEACDFWGIESDPKYYAKHWKDIIGYQIHNPTSNWTSGWDNVKCSLMQILTPDLALKSISEQIIQLRKANIYLKPFFQLIDHWKSKGYIPITLKED